MASINGFRVALYVVLWLFSAVLLGLTATRLHYTLFLPPFDPLNSGKPFYDPIVAELLVTSILALFWSSYIIHVIHRSYDYGRFSSFAAELLGLMALFTLFLVGAAISSTFWGDLFWCHEFWQCRLLTALVAFAWMCWVMTFALIVISVLFAVANSAFFHPLHGRYDPHSSFFGGNRKDRRSRWC
ncbi:hypothetical protein BD309DRAFT_927161 [Dichomitus squalens]|uniref:MARVEL domain-containing protein n=2 Tax=Dichomitus squalens TaxID=114155 RepID=A0A4Q9M764_9APHY|nr:uncharacterized protein DICSQDRAFT_172522 [Dichomitus squalens LYAD-421 SS1]EJF58863.1 hypothetical protein DICSQDRAFT_172522 [Dichomitus squalens LYAD-421 SS1]TBU21938.1 hypothetical protein BD311DRAFT_733737 [Dichomitus squalens]TBU40430.1 hypothetical protein BD309DRAFT_927161 [Dichomitus squalens]TBU52645.1 hypothetical protein BD310DRAFT_831779 [Dichomitus squalens]